MNDALPPSDENELSAEDLEVLRAFDAMENWNSSLSTSTLPPSPGAQESSTHTKPLALDDIVDEMMMVFVTEADEDISKMRRALNQLEQEEQINPARFVALQRAGHKLRGTAGAVDCHTIATIAHHVEVIAEQVTLGLLFPLIGSNALSQAVSALELLEKNLITYGSEQEGEALLAALATVYQTLNIDLQQPLARPAEQTTSVTHPLEIELVEETSEEAGVSVHIPARQFQDSPSSKPFIRIDSRRFEQLVKHSEHLAELRAPLDNAQAQVETALQDLHTAQARLQELESFLPTLLASSIPPSYKRNGHTSSSLIARILNDANQRSSSTLQRRIKARTSLARTSDPSTWDELQMERYTEKDTLIRSLREAIADVTVCASRVRIAYGQLELLLQDYITQVASVRSDTLLLRLAPLSTLVPRLQRAIKMSTLAQAQEVQFEVRGETTEIDEEILEALAEPLLQLLRTCASDTHTEDGDSQGPYRVWLHAQGLGNEIIIEIGFSMTVHGGAINAIRDPVQRLNGTIFSQRNTAGGVSFYLRFPRSHSAAQCLLIRAGNQHLIVPAVQVQRISEKQREKFDIFYHLGELLGFSAEDATADSRVQPVLIVAPGAGASRTTIGIAVDEIINELELIVRPLQPYLQRPGIVGAAVDGDERVLLMLDLPELVRYATKAGAHRQMFGGKTPAPAASDKQPGAVKILIADDSVYMRQSLLQTLQHAHYTVMEARDGMEALEQLLENKPDAFLLDVEMPNLNGYDLLSIMQLYPELASVRIIMLTSRSSEKHKQRARELGAHAYLTKPCDPETLLQTIRDQLAL